MVCSILFSYHSVFYLFSSAFSLTRASYCTYYSSRIHVHRTNFTLLLQTPLSSCKYHSSSKLLIPRTLNFPHKNSIFPRQTPTFSYKHHISHANTTFLIQTARFSYKLNIPRTSFMFSHNKLHIHLISHKSMPRSSFTPLTNKLIISSSKLHVSHSDVSLLILSLYFSCKRQICLINSMFLLPSAAKKSMFNFGLILLRVLCSTSCSSAWNSS
jgi:hypothetical protein